jgi:hypothetical protein
MLYDTQFRPRRLIEVGRRGKSPRLIETSSHGGDCSKYLALSHCWGKEMPEIATTKLSTLNERKAGITFRRLPQTFRDALTVTRGLDIQFLWIDSLCIVQDSAEDWQRESAVMGRSTLMHTVLLPQPQLLTAMMDFSLHTMNFLFFLQGKVTPASY